MMNCPNCGSATQEAQQYCRSCGEGLTADQRRGIRPQVWSLIILAVTFGGVLIALTGSMLNLRWLIFAGVFMCIGGMFSIAAYSLTRQMRPRSPRPKFDPPLHPEPLMKADTTNKLLPVGENDYIPSITEPTTDLLKQPIGSRSDLGS